jgi:phospholipid transport system substrate-binding protein
MTAVPGLAARPLSRFEVIMHSTYVPRFIVLLSVILLMSSPALAGEARDQIKQTTDHVLSILSDPAYKGRARTEERRREIRKAIDERFDWEEMAHRSLATHWSPRSSEERKEFVSLFADLVSGTYLDKLEGYSGEKIVYTAETVDGDRAVTRVKIVTSKNKEIPLEYRLLKKGSQWLIYDISIEGVSFVNNYRTQFNSIILKSGYDELVRKLKEKRVLENSKEDKT